MFSRRCQQAATRAIRRSGASATQAKCHGSRPGPRFTEGPERDVVLGVVVTRGEPVAIGLDVEQDARTAVEIAGNGLELQDDRAVQEIVHAIERCDRVIGELLHVIDEIPLRGVVEAPRSLGEQSRAVVLVRLSGLAIDHDDLVRAVLNHPPCPDDGLKGRGLLPDGIVRHAGV